MKVTNDPGRCHPCNLLPWLSLHLSTFLHLHRSLVRLPLVSLTRLVSSSPRSGSGTEGEKDERLTDGDRSGEVRGEKGKGQTT